MRTLQLPDPVAAPPRGRGLIITGTILLAVSIIGGIVGSVLTLGQFDGNEFTRDVIINGAANPSVPGRLSFEVDRPLNSDSGSDELPVGIAVDYSQLPVPTCTLVDADGVDVPLSRASAESTLLREDAQEMTVIGSASLAPGSYEARCTTAGEPSSSDATFTVGRVFGLNDFRGVFGPVLWFLAVGAIATLMFVIGLILLIVGLVRSSKAKKRSTGVPPGGYGPPTGYGQPGSFGPPTGSGQAGYGQPGSGQPGYGQPGYGPPAAWPGPHPPGQPAPGQQDPGAVPSGPYQPGPDAPPVPPPYTPAPPQPPEGDAPSPPESPPSGWTVPPSKKG